MNDLIKVTQNENGELLVSARDLYNGLELNKRFSAWIEQYVKEDNKYGFEKDIDFTSVLASTVVNNGAKRELQDYALKLDMAKEICMITANEKGKIFRKYFIECEKQLKENRPKLPTTYKEALIELVHQIEEKEKLEEQNQLMAPKADYFDNLVDRKLLTNFRDTAKQLGIKQKEFIDWLLENKYIYRDAKKKLKPYAQYVDDKLFELKDYGTEKRAGVQTLITPKGKETFRLLLNNK